MDKRYRGFHHLNKDCSFRLYIESRIPWPLPDDKRRHQVAQIMESYSSRAQYSVFECDISERQQMTLQGKLQEVIDASEDDIRFYPLNAADIKRVRTLGKATLHLSGGSVII